MTSRRLKLFCIRRALMRSIALIAGLPLLIPSALADELDALLAAPESEAETQAADSSSNGHKETELELIPLPADKPEPPEKDSPKLRRSIEEIIVTATKREQSIREVPGSISALTGDALEDQGLQSSTEFMDQVPGVNQIDDGQNSKRVTIRGIASEGSTNASTGVFLGDIPFSDPIAPRVVLDPNLFDFASVEVLKGPQGTLFGGSALNGAIRYLPQAPRLGEWEAKVFAQYETISEGDEGLIYGGAVNMPIGESIALRLTATDRRSGGWVDELQRGEDDVNSIRQDSLRAQLKWQPDDRWSVGLLHMQQDTLLEDIPITEDESGTLERDNTPRPSPRTTDYTAQSLTVEYAFDALDVVGIYGQWDKHFFDDADFSRLAMNDDSPPEGLRVPLINDSDARFAELRFVSGIESASHWKWVAGLFLFRSTLNEIFSFVAADDVVLPVGSGTFPIPGISGVLSEDGNLQAGFRDLEDVKLEEKAVFGEVTRTFLDSLDVTLGLRWYEISSRGTVILGGPIFANTHLTGGGVETVNHLQVKEDGVNPKLSVYHAINDRLAWYGSIAKGFRFGGIQITGDAATASEPVPETYESDVIWSYELGLRTQWLQNTLVVDITAYYIDWDQPQVLLTTPEGLFAYIDNAGSAKGEGLELSLQYLPPIDGLSINVTGAYTNTVTTATFTNGSGEEFPPGTEWPLSPKFQSSTSISYVTNVGALEVGGSLSHVYSDKAISNFDTRVPIYEYQLVNATLNLSVPVISWLPRFSVIVSNLTDERAIVGSGVSNSFSDRVYVRPRTLSIRLSADF